MPMLESVGNVYTWAAVVAAFAIGYLVYSKFSSPDDYSHKRTDEQEPKESAMASVTPPRTGDYTPQQLLEHDGRDPSKAILLSLFSERRPPVIPPASPHLPAESVYDVTAGASFYGPPSGPYSIFAGHDCTVALGETRPYLCIRHLLRRPLPSCCAHACPAAKMQIDASLLDSDSSGLSFSELDM